MATSVKAKGIISAIRQAIEHEMEHDPTVVVMGIDTQLGVWGYTRGLAARFGADRVRNTPISEYAITGMGIGAAMTGLRPIVDLSVANFLYTAWDQLANQAAKLPYMTNGALSIPMVVIATAGAGGSNAAQHSDVPTAPLVNVGCLRVIYPSTPEDAAGLMTTAIRCDEPVVYLYPGALGSQRGEPFEPGDEIPFGIARVRREGRDVTVWAAGLMTRRALEAAVQLEAEGISIEVIDPRTLNPLDEDTVIASVRKTGRFVAVDEARASCSLASEIVARVAVRGFSALTAPPALVAAPADVPIPYAPVLEARVVPTADGIADACRTVLAATSTS